MAKSKSKRIWLYIAVIFGSIFVGGAAGFLTAYLSSAPTLDQVNIVQDFTTYIYDINGRVITDLYRENRIPTDITKLPDHVKNAVIAIEDAQFYNHHGINFIAFGRAILVNLRTWDFTQGGGTITMQLARNVFLTQKKDRHAQVGGIPLGSADRAEILERRDPRSVSGRVLFEPRGIRYRSGGHAYFSVKKPRT